jgi:transcriptional regulator with XRE-family HTH domain
MAVKKAVSPIAVAVGSRILALRGLRQLSRRALARRAGMWHTNLILIERGTTAPSITTYAKIAAALGVDLSVLCGSDPLPACSVPASLVSCDPVGPGEAEPLVSVQAAC